MMALFGVIVIPWCVFLWLESRWNSEIYRFSVTLIEFLLIGLVLVFIVILNGFLTYILNVFHILWGCVSSQQ